MRSDTKRKYKRAKIFVYAGLFSVLILPAATIIQNVGQPPKLYLSPSPGSVFMDAPGLERNVTITVSSVHANSWDASISASCSDPNVMFAYLNGKMSPVEYSFVERGRDQNISMLITTSQQIPSADYNVTLKYQYTDGVGKTYEGQQNIKVSVIGGPTPTPTPIEPVGSGFSLSTNVLITVVGLIVELVAYAGIALTKLRQS